MSVSYTSSNPAAATIDGSGVITLKDVNASSVISAIFEGDDDYKDQTVSYTLNVSKAPFAVKDGVFDFVEAANQKPIEDYGSGMTTTVTYTTETQSATVQSYGWATYIPDFNVEFAANTAYVVTAASVSTGLKLAAVTQVPAGTPLLLMGSGVKSATVIGSASAPATNLLSVSNGSALASGEYAYVLAKNGEETCFKQWTGEMSTLKGRVMLVLDEAVAAARSVFYLDDETTGIKQIETSMPFVGGIYNLKGQRVAQPAKGLYIMNGKKVIIK